MAVLEVLAREDQALLVGRDAILVLDLGLNVIDRERWLDFEGDRLAGELDIDLPDPPELSLLCKLLFRFKRLIKFSLELLQCLVVVAVSVCGRVTHVSP